MYLDEALIRNNGPLADLHVEFTFTEDSAPIPHVFVGRNGSGKSNLLSIIADALIEAASIGHRDIVAHSASLGRNYFRVLGGLTIRFGAGTTFSILRFSEGDAKYFFREKAGDVDPDVVRAQVPESMRPGVKWDANAAESTKGSDISEADSKLVFQRGVYAYFPASRSESPHWLNQEAIRENTFDVADRVEGRLGRPLFVEHAVDRFAQWLLTLFTESRADIQISTSESGALGASMDTANDLPPLVEVARVFALANQVLQIIMNDHQARFVWLGRHNPRKLGVATLDSSANPPTLRLVSDGLACLSGGQATMLAIFGTLLSNGDAALGRKGFAASDIRGIVIVDEIDAHMHVDLQTDALPRLIALFPKVQFVLSSHSPLFALGLERL